MLMANSFHKSPSRIFLTIIIVMLMPSAWAQVPDIALQKALPIDLNADSSEFDRKNNILSFHDLRITQGQFSIEADEATVAKLDFENSRWTFTGNVVIENEDAKAYSDRAVEPPSDSRRKALKPAKQSRGTPINWNTTWHPG
jgi:lipopolysaccharide export system protein LptA